MGIRTQRGQECALSDTAVSGGAPVKPKSVRPHRLLPLCLHLMEEGRQVGQSCYINTCPGASLVVQRLRIRLPMQGTRVRALVWEDPTGRGATGPVSHNY